MASMSSAQIVSASVLHNKALQAQGMPPGTYNNENQGYQVSNRWGYSVHLLVGEY